MTILRAGALYFALAFGAGWVLGPIRELVVIPRFGRTVGHLVEAPLMLIVIGLAARWVVRRFAISGLGARTAMGLVALALLLAAELLGTRWLRGLAWAEYLAGFRSLPGLIALALFGLFAVAPVLVPPGPRAR